MPLRADHLTFEVGGWVGRGRGRGGAGAAGAMGDFVKKYPAD